MKTLEYMGLPMSALLPLTAKGMPINLLSSVREEEQGKFTNIINGAWWSYPVAPRYNPTLEIINALLEDGYEYCKAEQEPFIVTQLYDVCSIKTEQPERSKLWYKPTTISILPVILCFSLPPEASLSPKGADHILMLNPLPLPQLGEYAYIADEGRGVLCGYHILDLPLESRLKWVELTAKLYTLSAPALWPAYTTGHEIASDSIIYQQVINEVHTRIQQSQGKLQQRTRVLAIALETCKQHIEAQQQALSKSNRSALWKEVQSMAQSLAQDYYEFYQHKHNSQQQELQTAPIEQRNTTQALTVIETVPTLAQKKRTRRSHTPDTPIVAKGKEAITIRSDILNHEIMKSLRDKEGYQTYEEQCIAEHKHTFYQKDKGQILITIKPLDGESFDTILSALNTLGDACVDTFIALQAIAIDRNGTQHIRTPFEISPDDILAVCGKKKSHGSYTPYQRADIIAHLKTLSQAHIVATMPGQVKKGKREATVIKVEGALIDLLSWKIGEYTTITGEEIWERRSVSVGKWITMIPELNAKTATMLRQVLAYSAKNQRYQKRLGIYLTIMFRINAHRGGQFEVSTEKLLDGAGIVPDKRRAGEFRTAIEVALKQLQKEGVIGSYERIIHTTLEAQEREAKIRELARGWWDEYSKQLWLFEPSHTAKEQYKNLLSKSKSE